MLIACLAAVKGTVTSFTAIALLVKTALWKEKGLSAVICKRPRFQSTSRKGGIR
jgi:hypothetical protein